VEVYGDAAVTKKAALIGYGGIARDAVEALQKSATDIQLVGALCEPGRTAEARAALPGIGIVESLNDLLARRPNVVAEVASQNALAQFGAAILTRGVDLLVISIGALAEPKLLDNLKAAARRGNSRILLPAGAIGGVDAIAAMRLGGLHAVRYRSRKPPAAWRGTPAEKVADLDKLTSRTVLYRGTAGEAALLYPQNANVAATLGLAGLGLDATQVELVADPEAPGNVHEIEVEGAAGRFAIQLQGKPSRTNPKTSALAALSVARALINLEAAIVI
jgi:aspartate dehydrogenase